MLAEFPSDFELLATFPLEPLRGDEALSLPLDVVAALEGLEDLGAGRRSAEPGGFFKNLPEALVGGGGLAAPKSARPPLPYGLLMQLLSGLITSLLLAIYCHEEHGERVNIGRVRALRNAIRNEKAQATAAGVTPPEHIDLDFGAYATSLPDTAE